MSNFWCYKVAVSLAMLGSAFDIWTKWFKTSHHLLRLNNFSITVSIIIQRYKLYPDKYAPLILFVTYDLLFQSQNYCKVATESHGSWFRKAGLPNMTSLRSCSAVRLFFWGAHNKISVQMPRGAILLYEENNNQKIVNSVLNRWALNIFL